MDEIDPETEWLQRLERANERLQQFEKTIYETEESVKGREPSPLEQQNITLLKNAMWTLSCVTAVCEIGADVVRLHQRMAVLETEFKELRAQESRPVKRTRTRKRQGSEKTTDAAAQAAP